jgi:hypothetical protein
MTTVPGTSFPFASVTVNVSKFPAEDEVTVSGSIGWLKVAVTAVPVTTLSLVFVLVGTFVALLLGLDETTVGSVAAPTRMPGATVTPGATFAKTLPIPPPASKATNNNAMNIGGLYELSNLVIFLSLF